MSAMPSMEDSETTTEGDVTELTSGEDSNASRAGHSPPVTNGHPQPVTIPFHQSRASVVIGPRPMHSSSVSNSVGHGPPYGPGNPNDLDTRLVAVTVHLNHIFHQLNILQDFRGTAETLLTRHGLNRIPPAEENGNKPLPMDTAANGADRDRLTPITATDYDQPALPPYYVTTSSLDNLVTRVDSLVVAINGIAAQANDIAARVSAIDAHISRTDAVIDDVSTQMDPFIARYDTLVKGLNLHATFSNDLHTGLNAQVRDLTLQNLVLAARCSNLEAANVYAQQTHPSSPLNPTAPSFRPAGAYSPNLPPSPDLIGTIPRSEIAAAMTDAFIKATKGMKVRTLNDSIYAPKPFAPTARPFVPALTDQQLAQAFHERSAKLGIKIKDPCVPEDHRAQIEAAAYGSLDLFEKTFGGAREVEAEEGVAALGSELIGLEEREPVVEEEEEEVVVVQKEASAVEEETVDPDEDTVNSEEDVPFTAPEVKQQVGPDLKSDFLAFLNKRYLRPKKEGERTVSIPDDRIGDLDLFNALMQGPLASIPRVREGWVWVQVEEGVGGRRYWRLRVLG
ncbi:MAG: hypothetical protein Q9170_006172 [Blastenia crenularia]